MSAQDEATTPPSRRRGRTLWRRVGIVALVIAAIPLSILGYQEFLRQTGNFRTVVEGQLYRSAQPTPERLRTYIETQGIKTVINLRGAQPGVTWYDAERDMTRRMHVRLINFPMSAGELLPVDRARALITLFRDAPKPILIHCKTGADRSGLAAVIYASQVAGKSEDEAEYQLNPIYGHFGIPFFSPTYAMDQSWEVLERAFGIEGS